MISTASATMEERAVMLALDALDEELTKLLALKCPSAAQKERIKTLMLL